VKVPEGKVVLIVNEAKPNWNIKGFDTQNRWVYDVSVHRQEFKTTVRKLDLFPSLGEGNESPTLFGPLERANFNH
jgi:hypothetical protein